MDELSKQGIKIVASSLSRIEELRIVISLPNGGKVVILHSQSGGVQDAGVFTGVDAHQVEVIGVQSGGMRMWTPGDDDEPQARVYSAGECAVIDPTKPHATHPDKDAWIVAFMTGDWSKAKKSGDVSFDECVDAQLAAT